MAADSNLNEEEKKMKNLPLEVLISMERPAFKSNRDEQIPRPFKYDFNKIRINKNNMKNRAVLMNNMYFY